MKSIIQLSTFLIIANTSIAQNVWIGKFSGEVNGDPAVMDLFSDGVNKVKGTLHDSEQNFDLAGDVTGNRMALDAVEKKLGMTFVLLGELKGNSAELKLMIELNGQMNETSFVLTKQSTNNVKIGTPKTTSTGITYKQLPMGSKLDPKIVGKWTKNETYNSGSGSNFMGANFSQSLVFLADGSLAEGGSNASMSGSNYSGQSSGNGNSELEGISWYVKGTKLYLSIEQNGQKQEVPLGKYFIENNNMLITGENGEKLLLSR